MQEAGNIQYVKTLIQSDLYKCKSKDELLEMYVTYNKLIVEEMCNALSDINQQKSEEENEE